MSIHRRSRARLDVTGGSAKLPAWRRVIPHRVEKN